jgi:hypothetical protein
LHNGLCEIFKAIACSLPPDPSSNIFIMMMLSICGAVCKSAQKYKKTLECPVFLDSAAQ